MGSFQSINKCIFLLQIICLLTSCGIAHNQQSDQNEEAPTNIQTEANGSKETESAKEVVPTTDEEKPSDPPQDIEETPKARAVCSTKWQRPLSNLKMEDVVALINTLPKPVTIPCVLDVLPRPFAINATTSDLSVQPADGIGNPRIFIAINFLIITFTMAADEPPALEFSQLLSDDESVKGEITFPVTQDLMASAPYTQVVREGNIGTRCAACHFNERPATSSFPANAFISKALRPFARQDVSFDLLKEMSANCATIVSDRCDILQSLFRGAEPTRYNFPSAMPTLF